MRVLPALPVLLALLFARDAPARTLAPTRTGADTPATLAERTARTASWAEALSSIEVTSVATGATASVRLYGDDGEIDEAERARFERVVAREQEPHALAPRLEQLVVKASHHFQDARVLVVSGWREHAGRHSACEALDFKLEGVTAPLLASYLRGLPLAGVGIYTHPRTQFVHLDVRAPSFHWIDASPPGVRWKERAMRDPGQVQRDAAWTPSWDLP